MSDLRFVFHTNKSSAPTSSKVDYRSFGRPMQLVGVLPRLPFSLSSVYNYCHVNRNAGFRPRPRELATSDSARSGYFPCCCPGRSSSCGSPGVTGFVCSNSQRKLPRALCLLRSKPNWIPLSVLVVFWTSSIPKPGSALAKSPKGLPDQKRSRESKKRSLCHFRLPTPFLSPLNSPLITD